MQFKQNGEIEFAARKEFVEKDFEYREKEY